VSADHKRREAWQRRTVRARDNKNGQPCCRFEVWDDKTQSWKECGSKAASDTCHIYRRAQCAKAWSHEDVALLGCRKHHDAYDNYETWVRVSPGREAKAWEIIVASSKVRPVRHIPLERPPEAGAA
jgi:hypothetical protein